MNKVTLDADFVLRFVLANRLNVVFCIAVIQVRREWTYDVGP